MLLLDARLLSQHPTGISRYTQEYLDFYIETYGRDRVAVILNASQRELVSRNLKIIEVKSRALSLRSLIEVQTVLKKYRPAIFHSPFYANSLFKIRGVYYVTTYHDLMYQIVRDFFGKSKIRNFIGKKYFNFIVKRAISNSDLNLSVSGTTRIDLKSIFGAESIFISNGYNEPKSNMSSLKRPTQLPSQIADKRFWLYVGNFRPHKGLVDLQKARALINDSTPLVICGVPLSDYKYISVDATDTYLIKDATDDNLNWLYGRCQAFVMPSIYEGFGLPILEASFHGADIISSTGGALKEFKMENITHFNAGDIFDLSQKLLNFKSSNLDKQSLRQFIIQNYSWRETQKRILNFIDKILNDEKIGSNILYVDDSPVIGGHQFKAIDILIELSKKNKLVCLASQTDWYRERLPSSIAVQNILPGKGPFAAIRAIFSPRIFEIFAKIKKMNFTAVLVCQGAAEMGTVALWAAKIARVKSISYIPMAATPKEMKLRYPQIRTLLQGIILRSFDLIVTISQSEVDSFCRRGLPREKMRFVPNKVKMNRNSRVSNSTIKSSRSIAVIGRVSFEQKGQDKLIEYSKCLTRKSIHHVLNIIGDGPDLSRLKEMVNLNGISENFRFEGWSNNPIEHLLKADIILCSSNFEGVPLVMLEAIENSVPFFAPEIDPFFDYLPLGQIYKDADDLAKKIIDFENSPAKEKEISMNFSLNQVKKLNSEEFFKRKISELMFDFQK